MPGNKSKLTLHLRPSPRNLLGILLSLAGFLLILLCLIGCQTWPGRGLHFARITERPSRSLTIYVSWRGYCIAEGAMGHCRTNDNVMTLPFDATMVDMFNETYPHLFVDPIEQDEALNPLSAPSPPHNPKMYAASVLCLLCGGAATVIGAAWTLVYPRFQDRYFSRGFFAMGAAVVALLLLANSTVMYQNGVEQLNLKYPHLEATVGPNVAITGVAFATFVIASYIYLHGCLKADDGDYSPL